MAALWPRAALLVRSIEVRAECWALRRQIAAMARRGVVIERFGERIQSRGRSDQANVRRWIEAHRTRLLRILPDQLPSARHKRRASLYWRRGEP